MAVFHEWSLKYPVQFVYSLQSLRDKVVFEVLMFSESNSTCFGVNSSACLLVHVGARKNHTQVVQKTKMGRENVGAISFTDQ